MVAQGEGTVHSPEALDTSLSEIDALVSQVDADFVSGNIATFLDAGVTKALLVEKLTKEAVVENVEALLAGSVDQSVIFNKLGAFDAVRNHETLTRAGIVLDPDWVLAAITEWTETQGFIPYDALITKVDFLIEIGIGPNDIYALIMNDNHSGGLLLEVLQRLIDAGATIPMEVINRAIKEVEGYPSNRYSDNVLKNLFYLQSIGADVHAREIVEGYIESDHAQGTSPLITNIGQVRRVLPDVDIDVLIEGANSYALDDRVGYLIQLGADPRTLASRMGGEKIQENMPTFIRAYEAKGYPVDELLERFHYFDRTLNHLEQLKRAGASNAAILRTVTGFGVLREIDRLLDNDFTIDELVEKLNARERIENYEKLSARGAKINLDESVDSVLDIDEYEPMNFPDAYENAAKFLLTNLPTLQKCGADITRITAKEELREILDGTMTDAQKLQFTLARLKVGPVDRG